MKDILAKIKNVLFFLLSFGIVLTLYLNDSKITKLEKKLSECEQNVIYNNTTDTIDDPCVEYVETKVPSDPEYKEIILYLEKNLSLNDSLEIGRKVMHMITDYNTARLYDNVFKNDSSAFIEFRGIIYKNNLVSPEIIFQNRYPAYVRIPEEEQTEIFAGFGGYTKGITVNAGLITKKNIMYQLSVDPINKYYGGSVNYKIFGFK